MAHFADIDENNIVTRVLVVPNEHEWHGAEYLTQIHGLSGNWIQCSYNNNIRGVFPGIGYIYLPAHDRFVAPAPFPSWTLNETTFDYEPPVPEPEPPANHSANWDEALQEWVFLPIPTVTTLGGPEVE